METARGARCGLGNVHPWFYLLRSVDYDYRDYHCLTIVFMIARHHFYKHLREKIGTRSYVCKLLKIRFSTMWRREVGKTPITDEMIAALEFWIQKDKK